MEIQTDFSAEDLRGKTLETTISVGQFPWAAAIDTSFHHISHPESKRG